MRHGAAANRAATREPAPTARQCRAGPGPIRRIERVHDKLGIWPRKLIGDTGYGSAETLTWLVHERDIEPHPVFDKSNRTEETFSRTHFSFDVGENGYTCLAGKLL